MRASERASFRIQMRCPLSSRTGLSSTLSATWCPSSGSSARWTWPRPPWPRRFSSRKRPSDLAPGVGSGSSRSTFSSRSSSMRACRAARSSPARARSDSTMSRPSSVASRYSSKSCATRLLPSSRPFPVAMSIDSSDTHAAREPFHRAGVQLARLLARASQVLADLLEAELLEHALDQDVAVLLVQSAHGLDHDDAPLLLVGALLGLLLVVIRQRAALQLSRLPFLELVEAGVHDHLGQPAAERALALVHEALDLLPGAHEAGLQQVLGVRSPSRQAADARLHMGEQHLV